MKFRLIADQRETFPVRVMCDVMGELLVRLGRQKREDVICCFAFLHFPNGGPARPDAGKKAN
jgi:hypothetical protein